MFKYYVYNFQALKFKMESALRQAGHGARTGEVGIF